MFSQALIFSEARHYRIKRHLLFWFTWWVYFAATHAANPFNNEIAYFRNPVYTITESIFLLLAQLPLTYSMLYVVLPFIIPKRKYIIAILLTIVVWAAGGLINMYLITNLFPRVMSLLLPDELLMNTRRPASVSFFMAILATYKGAFTVTGFALFLKFAKYWYLKEQRNLQLQKENTDAQLQLLTAQVHPHFLFNTLNNIYSKTQLESPGGSRMILELSHIMRYVLDEGRKPLVPLENELQLLQDYINLEKIRYDNRLDLHFSVPEKADHIFIAPLLLLPFVENSFKHGTSKMIQHPWINLKIELLNEKLVMKLMNGKLPSTRSLPDRKGTGIENAQKRLAFLYPEKHALHIENGEEVFVVNLTIDLVSTNNIAQKSQYIPSTEKVYAEN